MRAGEYVCVTVCVCYSPKSSRESVIAVPSNAGVFMHNMCVKVSLEEEAKEDLQDCFQNHIQYIAA